MGGAAGKGCLPTMQIDTYCTLYLYLLHSALSISLHQSLLRTYTYVLMFSIRHMTGVGAEEQRVLNGSYIIWSTVCT